MDINADSFNSTLDDLRVLRATRAWSACMAEAGFSFQGPFDPPGNESRFNTKEATKEERAIASADVECKRRTSLVGIWSQAEQEYQEKQIRAHHDELSRILSDLHVQIARADKVLASATQLPE